MASKMKDKDISETEAQGRYVINQKNVMDFLHNPQNVEKSLLNQGSLWHKIIVHNVINNNREIVLKDLLNAVHPHDLIPVNYKIEGKNANFIARNCGPAIHKLCKDNLFVRSNSTNETYVLTIILGFSNTVKTQLNVQSNIQSTITKRYNAATKTLNLDTFHKDGDLSELIFCILSQPKILYFVLHLAKSLQIHSLKLSNNEIRDLSPLELLWQNKGLASIDLRNNFIEDESVLKPLKNIKITEIWLDGNPICNKFENDAAYIEMVKDVCPMIEKIDGTLVNSKGLLAYRRNYLVDNDCQQVVDQFLSHFFTLYDSPNRRSLEGAYSKDAIFTLSSSYLPDQNTSQNSHLESYKKYSRNLKTMSDFSKSAHELMIGERAIIERLYRLPQTEHDPYTFTVDVSHFSPKTILLVVTGAFKEPPTSLNSIDPIYGFSRTFLLSQKDHNEYQILNELLHITNATTSLALRSFKIAKPPEANIRRSLKPNFQVKENNDKNDFVQAFCKITTLNKFWAKKCLEDANWDFKNALMLFIELYKNEKFNSSAFKNPQDFF